MIFVIKEGGQNQTWYHGGRKERKDKNALKKYQELHHLGQPGKQRKF